MLGQEWGGDISRPLNPIILFQAMLHSVKKPPHHCALPVCICLASSLGLSLPLIDRSQDKTFNKTSSEQNVEAEVLPQKIRGAVENRSLALCTGLWTGTVHAVLQLWPTKLKAAWPCIWADSGLICIFNILTNRGFAVGSLTPFDIFLSGSHGGKAVSDQKSPPKEVRNFERFWSDFQDLHLAYCECCSFVSKTAWFSYVSAVLMQQQQGFLLYSPLCSGVTVFAFSRRTQLCQRSEAALRLSWSRKRSFSLTDLCRKAQPLAGNKGNSDSI